jgi:hypothetical protein
MLFFGEIQTLFIMRHMRQWLRNLGNHLKQVLDHPSQPAREVPPNCAIAQLSARPQKVRVERAGIGHHTLQHLDHLARHRPALRAREASGA